MTEATHTLQLAQLRARLRHAAYTISLQAALKATKRRLQSQGLRVNQIPMRDLRALAEAYLAQHREALLADASELVEQWRLEGFFGKRALACCPGALSSTQASNPTP
jgi:hypothetical protein